MNGRVVSDIQTRAEGERLYVRYNTDANIVKYLWYEWMYSSKILEIGMILGEKIERNVYVNQQNFVSDIQLLIKHSFILSFHHELLMSVTNITTVIVVLFINSVGTMVGGAPLNTKSASRSLVTDGCSSKATCQNNVCSKGSVCKEGWRKTSCVCRNGFVGKNCVDICSLQPCQNGATCKRMDNAVGFECTCPAKYLGKLQISTTKYLLLDILYLQRAGPVTFLTVARARPLATGIRRHPNRIKTSFWILTIGWDRIGCDGMERDLMG